MIKGAVEIRGVGKAFRGFPSEWSRFASWFSPRAPTKETWVLRDISLDVRPGESVGIVGRNGAGKSTLLKLLTGVMAPTTGSVRYGGKLTAILELGMGFSGELTGRDNATHAAGLLGHSREDIARTVPEIERFADIGPYFDQPLRTYSSGMQVRVAFAVATAFTPDILIVDEALSVGDLFFQAKCWERINHLRKGGCTFIFVTHGIGDVVKHCDRAIFLRDGRAALDGEPKDVTNAYLDHLFGKPKLEVGTVGREVAAHFQEGKADVFHTRPGFRPEEYRWGVGGARIVDYYVAGGGREFPPQLESNSEVEISYKVCFDRDVERPIYGLLIKTHDGVFLYGTNSRLLSRSLDQPSVRAGEIVACTFKLPLDLNAGGYLVSLGVSEDRGETDLVPLDRRYDSILISVARTAEFWGISDLRAQFSIAPA